MYVIPQPDRILLAQDIKFVSGAICGKVLDVGAGAFNRYGGLFASESYVRVDIITAPNIDVVADVHSLPFPNNSFPAVVSTQVIEHVREPLLVVEEMLRVLVPGGILLITAPQMNELHEEPFDYWRYTRYGLRQLVESKGGEVINTIQRGGVMAVLAQIIIRYLIDRFRVYDMTTPSWVKGGVFIAGSLITRLSLWLDKRMHSVAARKHSLGWLILARKRNLK